jgi:hypothetical protein
VTVTPLTIYGDFNCPYSALASVRADVLLSAGGYVIDWRAVQHDVTIPPAGEPVEGDTAVELESELSKILELSELDGPVRLALPPVRPNTAAASATFAASGHDAHRVRRGLFTALWAEGRNIGDPGELDRLGTGAADVPLANRWQNEFDALAQPVTPTLVLPDRSVSPGLDALSRLADLAAESHPAGSGSTASERGD